MNKEHSFHYTYSAERQEEIQKIRSKYLPPEEDKMTRLPQPIPRFFIDFKH